MTLQQYGQQQQIERLAAGSVLLQQGEFSISEEYAGFRNVYVNAYKYTYICKSDGLLYSMDNEGHPKDASVFRVPAWKTNAKKIQEARIPKLTPTNGRTPVIVRMGDNYETAHNYGVQFWTPEMIEIGFSQNTDRTFSYFVELN